MKVINIKIIQVFHKITLGEKMCTYSAELEDDHRN